MQDTDFDYGEPGTSATAFSDAAEAFGAESQPLRSRSRKPLTRPRRQAQPQAGAVRATLPTTSRSLPLHDPEQLGQLLLDLEPRLFAVALRFTRDAEAARDVVQNAFEKVLRHGERFRGNSRVSTWVHRIVANEALMWLRTERRRSGLHRVHDDVLTELADPSPDAGERAHHRRQLSCVQDALQGLSAEERDVVMCCALSGESYRDYGHRTDTHPSAVKSRAFRARKRLEDALETR